MATCSVQPGARCCCPVHAKPTHHMECVSVDFTVLQQSDTWNRMYVCWIGCASTIPHMQWNVYLLNWLCINNPTHEVECVSVDVAVHQQSHAWSGMCICWLGCASTIPCMKWNVYLLTWLCFNNPMQEVEGVSVDVAVLQQSHTWSGRCICWLGCASTIPHMQWNVYLLTWLCLNNPTHEVEGVSVDLAVHQQPHAWSGRCICWIGCASTIPHMKWKVYLLTWLCINNPTHEVEGVSVDLAVHQQSHAWSGMCICWLGCASTIPCKKWNVYLLTWLCINNPMQEVECVSVDLAVLQQSHARSGMCICWLGCASTIQHMKWFQQSHAWSGMCICWLGCASTIQHMKWFQQSHAWSGMCICWLGCASTIQHMKWFQQSHAWSGMCICWLGCASTIQHMKWFQQSHAWSGMCICWLGCASIINTWSDFNNPMHEVECVSVDLAVLQQSNTWSNFNNPMHEVECVSVDLAVLQQSNTWSDFNNPMHEVECVSVDLAELQQSNTWSDFNNPMHEVECVSVDLAVLQQSNTWSGMCICWCGCASIIPCMKWNVYLLTWLCVNNDKKLRQWFLRYTLARQSCCDFPLPWWSRKSLGSYLIYWSKTHKIYTDFLHFQIPVRIKREKEMQVRHTKTLAHTDTKHTHTHRHQTHTHTQTPNTHTHTDTKHTHTHRHQTHTHTQTPTHTHTQTPNTHTHTHTCACMCTPTPTHTYTDMHAQSHLPFQRWRTWVCWWTLLCAAHGMAATDQLCYLHSAARTG